MEKQHLTWRDTKTIQSKSFQCGYCGNPLAAEKGFTAYLGNRTTNTDAVIMICHRCSRPTFFDHDGAQVPGVTFGNDVPGVSDESVVALYDEARKTTGAGCYTSAVLACRKLLMHIAVSKGAKAGDSFVSYVEFLSDKNYVPPDAKDWVDHIRKIGNEANHEIAIMKRDDAEELLSFIEMLLKVIFEFPAQMKQKYGHKASNN